MTTILNEWESLAESERGPVVTIATDGASIMNSALHELVTVFNINRSSPIGTELFGNDGSGLLLFNTCCGRSPEKPLVDIKDGKHVLKRYRMALKRKAGILIREITFDRQLITRLLKEIGLSEKEIENMWGEGQEDAQNVIHHASVIEAWNTVAAKSISRG